MSLTVISLKAAKIAALNDALRTTLMGGKIVMTAGINAMPDRTKANILTSVRNFSDFNKDNDPHGEHDCAMFDVDGHGCMFRIDYYDKALQYGSEDPADPNVTTRVLTGMLASDY